MPKSYTEMDLITFQGTFSTDAACRERLFNPQWHDGFRCPRCGSQEAYHIENLDLFQCVECRHQASLAAKLSNHPGPPHASGQMVLGNFPRQHG
ncbi:transposase [Desulfolutivibrio sulfoxidireducens]|uniref:transposase n=1 Tax=Desulfolutivibrio sulfoxidireducens TaxID=2773299 RepID=UPI00159DF5FA|nr:hypothetical protein GD604_11605 [Desulfolutivibrio sulfoxidireducens]